MKTASQAAEQTDMLACPDVRTFGERPYMSMERRESGAGMRMDGAGPAREAQRTRVFSSNVR